MIFNSTWECGGEWDALNLLTYIGSCDPFGPQGPEISGLDEQKLA